MTLFARYFDENKVLKKVSMDEMKSLITDNSNKDLISKYIYHHLYERFLKPFSYQNHETANYTYGTKTETKNKFRTEFKNGFLMMASSCLLIETTAAFLLGIDKTNSGDGKKNYNVFFKKCLSYGNNLKDFHDKEIYKNIRNGILHQGETYGTFKIKREGSLINEDDNTINATEFIKELEDFLKSYTTELKQNTCKWDSELWDNCRRKIRFIISNSEE